MIVRRTVPTPYLRVATMCGALLMALTLVGPAGSAWANSSVEGSAEIQNEVASTGRFTCELPRASAYATCQTDVRKPADRALQVRNIASAGRQITARTRDSSGNTTSGRSMSEGESRILVNQTVTTRLYNIEARTRFPFVSRTRFTGESSLR